MLDLSYLTSIYLVPNCLSCQLLIFRKEMEEVCLVTLLTLRDIPEDQIPFEVGRIDSFSTFTPRYITVTPSFSQKPNKKTKKKLEKMLVRFV